MNDTKTNSEIIEAVLKTLNEAVAADTIALDRLLKTRVECNSTLGDHPHIGCVAFRSIRLALMHPHSIWATARSSG
jgi:hypothetical protein